MGPSATADTIQHRIYEFLSRSSVADPLHRFGSVLDKTADLYVVGGALRNIVIEFFHGAPPPTQDIDLFIRLPHAGLKPEAFFEDGSYSFSDFGGIRWQPADSEYVFDLCRLQDFVIFKKYRLPPTLKNLLRAIDFDINNIVFDLRRNIFHERACLAAVRRRVMDFNSTLFYNKKTTAYRILLIRYKCKFGLSRATFDFLKHEMDLETAVLLKRLFNAKLGRAMAVAIMKDYDRICKYRDYRQYRERAPEAQNIFA